MAKRNIFRGLAAVLALGMCMTGLAGCGSEKRADGKTEIEVVSYKPEAVKAFEKIEKRFNETHDDIHLTISSPNEAMTILKTRFIREDYPDIIAIGGDINYSNFLDADLFDDISDLDEVQTVKQAYLDMDKELEFIPKDGTYALPYVANAAGILYNKDLFEQAGITEEPKTWDEFKDVCQKLKDAGITPMTMDDAYATCVIGYHLARLVGEDKVKEIVTEGEWDDPAVLQMAQDIEELASNGYYSEMVGSNVWPAGQNTELALGTAAMYLNGSWLPNEVKEMAGPDFHWGCFAYPALTDGANGIETNNFGAQVFGINKDTKLAKEAFDLITFLTKGEYDQKLADETVGIPADTTNTEWPAMVECAKPVIEQSTNRFTWACGVESNVDMTPVIKENFIKLMAGSITADEFVSSMQDAAK